MAHVPFCAQPAEVLRGRIPAILAKVWTRPLNEADDLAAYCLDFEDGTRLTLTREVHDGERWFIHVSIATAPGSAARLELESWGRVLASSVDPACRAGYLAGHAHVRAVRLIGMLPIPIGDLLFTRLGDGNTHLNLYFEDKTP